MSGKERIDGEMLFSLLKRPFDISHTFYNLPSFSSVQVAILRALHFCWEIMGERTWQSHYIKMRVSNLQQWFLSFMQGFIFETESCLVIIGTKQFPLSESCSLREHALPLNVSPRVPSCTEDFIQTVLFSVLQVHVD